MIAAYSPFLPAMPSPRLIVCEKTSRWAVALRRALGQRGDVLLETRSLPECLRQLEATPASLVAVESTAANLEAVLAAFPAWSRRFAGCRLIALADPAMKPAHLLLREAGASAVLFTTRKAPQAARFACRHLSLVPPEDLSLRETILGRLPWPRATASST